MKPVVADSFSEADIPRDFRLLFRLPNQKVPDLASQLHRGILKGVRGITATGAVLQLRMLGQNRNAMLIMPGRKTVELNHLSRLMYDNPDYLVSKDLAAAQRVLGDSFDKSGTIRRIIQHFDDLREPQDREWVARWRSLDSFPYDRLASQEFNSVRDLAAALFEDSKPYVEKKIQENKAWASEESLKERYQALLDVDRYTEVLRKALLMFGKSFAWEGEWLVKDGLLKVPEGSRLLVLDSGPSAAEAKALIEQADLNDKYRVSFIQKDKMQQASRHLSQQIEKLMKPKGEARVSAAPEKLLYRTYVGEAPYTGPGSFWSPSADTAVKYGPSNGKLVSEKPRGKVLTVSSDMDLVTRLVSLGVENAEDLVMSSDWLTDDDVLSALREAGFSWVDRPVDLNQSNSDREWIKISAAKEGPDQRTIRRMKHFFTKKWKEEKGRPDLTGACIFATAFARAVLGTGTVKGNWHHIWLEVDGQKIDLTEAFGVREQALERLEKQKRYAEQGYEELAQAMTPPGFVGPDVDPWSHDATFITHSPDFRDTWRSVQNTSRNWAKEFKEGAKFSASAFSAGPNVSQIKSVYNIEAWSEDADITASTSGVPVLYHGTTKAALPKILSRGIKTTVGWGGANSEGVFLSGSKTGALMWAMSSLLSKNDEGGDPTKFYARGYSLDDLALVEIRIPEDRLADLNADMEQAEDYQYDGDEDDWKASLDQIGDVRFDGAVPAAWVKEVSRSDVEKAANALGYRKTKASTEDPLVTVELTCIMQPDDDDVALERSDCTREMYVVAEKIARQHGGRVDKSEHYDFGENTLYGDAYARIPASALLKVLDLFDSHDIGYDNIDIPDGVDDALVSTLEARYRPRSGVMVNDNRTTVSASSVDVAPTLYHGCCPEDVERLLREGWTPRSSQTMGPNGGQSKYLYLSTHKQDALWFAEQRGCNSVVAVHNVPMSYLRVDPEDGAYDSVEEEINNPHGLPGKLVATVALPRIHFSVLSGVVDVTASTSVAAKPAKDLPKRFFVVMPFSPGESYSEKPVQDLARGVLSGVRGISDHAGIIMQWYGVARDAVLSMDAEQLVKLNNLSRVQYDNPHYLVSDGMSALRRIFNTTESPKAAATQLAGNLRDYLKSGVRGDAISQVEKLMALIQSHETALTKAADQLDLAVKGLTSDPDDISQQLRPTYLSLSDIQYLSKSARKQAESLGLLRERLLREKSIEYVKPSTYIEDLSGYLVSMQEGRDKSDEAVDETMQSYGEADALKLANVLDSMGAVINALKALSSVSDAFSSADNLGKKHWHISYELSDSGTLTLLEKVLASVEAQKVNSVPDLAKLIHASSRNSGLNTLTVDDWILALTAALKKIGSVYKDEGEWIVKDRVLKIPPGSTLWITRVPLPADLEERRVAGILTKLDRVIHGSEIDRADAIDNAIRDLKLDQRYNVKRIDRRKFDEARSKWWKRRDDQTAIGAALESP